MKTEKLIKLLEQCSKNANVYIEKDLLGKKVLSVEEDEDGKTVHIFTSKKKELFKVKC